MSYAEKLRDPRWQKKRLEILERAHWKCEHCNADNLELQVHHLAYHNDPWDVTNEQLECLCWRCHEIRESINIRLKKMILSFSTSDAMLLDFEVDQFLKECSADSALIAKTWAESLAVLWTTKVAEKDVG